MRKLTYLILTMLLTGLSSCQWVADPVAEPTTTDDGTTFRLTLTVLSNTSAGTRADDDFEEVGSDAENYIDFTGGDYRIVLFDKDGNYLMEFGKESPWTLVPGPAYGSGYEKYLMEIEYKFPETYDYDKLEEIRNEGIYVMVVANRRSLDGLGDNNTFDYAGKFGVPGSSSKLSELWTNRTTLNYPYALGAGMSSWQPEFSEERKRLIPMFGYSKVAKFAPHTTGGKYSARVTIPMQRAMAKIEVIDNLEHLNFKLKNVVMTDFNQSGRIIPDVAANPTWDQIGTQVTKSSLPAEVNNYKPEGGIRLFQSAPDSKMWIAYVPEMALSRPVFEVNSTTGVTTNILDLNKNENRTHINVDIDFNDGTSAVYPVHFAKYDQNFKPTISDESWNHILRNHIYRFSINNVGINAELELHVVPWSLDQDEVWDFTDHVTVGQKLKWVSGSYENIDSETGRVLLWIGQEEKVLEGTFKIKTPVNGRWIARLTALDDANPNAITFVDEDGNALEPSHGDPPVCLEATGIIEEVSPVTIRIKATNNGNDDLSAFRLDFYVENLGVWMRVPMVNEDDGTFANYIIVRKSNRLL